jgi:hypothetical protein
MAHTPAQQQAKIVFPLDCPDNCAGPSSNLENCYSLFCTASALVSTLDMWTSSMQDSS